MKINQLKAQKGNVLFLILIAVALFAALSYAVTQSSRSGSDASKETNVINTASLTQYPNAVRTSVLRMIISGYTPELLLFNKPDEFTGGGFTKFVAARGVFHPQGGGAAYQSVPANLTLAGNAPIDWKFNINFEVPLLGLSESSSGNGNDLIAFAPGVAQSICGRVNKELHGSDVIPVVASAVTIDNDRTATTTDPADPAAEVAVLTAAAPNAGWFSNKAFGCFENGTASKMYVFYYVLAER